MRHRIGMTDTVALATQGEQDIAAAISSAMRRGTDALKADWRGQIEGAGLGSKLARTVQGRTYPSGADSLDQATWVFTKAPRLVDAFDRGPVIVPTHGQFFLAIPTDKVPRKGGKRMTPLDVEVAFNQDLIIKPGRNGNLLAFVDAAMGRFSKSQGAAYGRRKQVRRGKPQLVLMFTLVRQTRVLKRLDLDTLAKAASARYPDLLTSAWLAIPDRTAGMKGL